MSSINLEQQRKRAKDLRRAHRDGKLDAAVRILRHLSRTRKMSLHRVLDSPFALSDAQFVVAREAGFSTWPELKRHVEGHGEEALIDAAMAGTALPRDPSVALRSIYLACALADVDAVLSFLNANPKLADKPGGRRQWRPLLYLCSSRYQIQELSRDRAVIGRRLLELGAVVTGREPNFSSTHGTMLTPDNELFAIEAAAGSCASPELVQVLLDAGADLTKTTVALVQSVRGGNPEVLRRMLQNFPPEVSWQVGWALGESVTLNRLEMTRLLAAHAQLPAKGPLLQAIQLHRDREMLKVLVGEDNLSGRKVRGQAYRCAVRFGNHVAQQLLQDAASESGVTILDRLLGASIDADDATFRSLLPLQTESLGDNDHRTLAWAIRNGRKHAVPMLLQAGLDPNIADRDGQTPLHLAVRSGDLQTTDTLLQAGAKVDERNFESQTALDVAAALPDGGAREALTRRLLDAGANPALLGLLDGENMDAMFERAADAIAIGDVEALRELLDKEPLLVEVRSPRPHRAMLIHYCGANGVEGFRQRTPAAAPAILRLLLERGADVHATCDLYGGGANTTGLMLTSIHPLRAGLRTKLLEILINAGAEFDRAPGLAGLSGAAAVGRLDLVQAHLLNSPTKAQIQSAFLHACEFGRKEVVEFLLDKGVDLNGQDGDGQTCTHLAAISGHLDIVQLLLQHHAPLEIQNNWGGTVLNNVLWGTLNCDPHIDYTPIIETLLAAGAEMETGTLDWWRGQMPLFAPSKDRIEQVLQRYSTDEDSANRSTA